MLFHKAAKVKPVSLKQYFMYAVKHKFRVKGIAPPQFKNCLSRNFIKT